MNRNRKVASLVTKNRFSNLKKVVWLAVRWHVNNVALEGTHREIAFSYLEAPFEGFPPRVPF